MSRPSVVRLAVAAASILVVIGGGCGRNVDDPPAGEPGALTRRAAALVGTGVTIDPAGYLGAICFGPAGCVNGTTVELDVPDGTHAITAPAAEAPGGGPASLGTLTVSRTPPSVTMTSTYFDPAGSGFVAKTTAPITYDNSGYLGYVIVRAVGFAANLRLLKNLRYRLDGNYTNRPGGDHAFSSGSDLQVLADGSLQMVTGQEADLIFTTAGTPQGPQLVVRASALVKLSYQSNGTPVYVGLHTLNTFLPGNNSVLLVRNRQYKLVSDSGLALRVEDHGTTYSGAFDVQVLTAAEEAAAGGAGPVKLIDGTDAKNTFTVAAAPDGALLSVPLSSLVKVTYESLGIPDSVQIGGIHGFGPGYESVLLIRNRLYQLRSGSGYSSRPENNDNTFSADHDLQTHKPGQEPNGVPFTVVPGSDATRLFTTVATADGAQLRVRPEGLTAVSFELNDTRVSVGLWGLHYFTPTTPTASLLRFRRYHLQGWSSYNLTNNDSLFTAGHFTDYDLETMADGSVTIVPGKTAATQFRTTPGSATFRPVLTNLRVTPGGYTGAVCLHNIACSAPATDLNEPVIVNRRYIIQPSGATVDVDAAGNCVERTLVPTTLVVSCQPVLPVGVPAAPSNVQANLVEWFGTSGTVHVTWTDNSSDETGFSIERRTGVGVGDDGYAVVGTAVANTGGPTGGYVDPVTPGTYSYRVQAIRGAAASAYSDPPATVTVGPVAAITLQAVVVPPLQVNLSWTPLSGATSATLYRTIGGLRSVLTTLAVTATAHPDVTVLPATTYTYEVEATNLAGITTSNAVTVTLPAGSCTVPSMCDGSPPPAPPVAAEPPPVGADFHGVLKGELGVTPTGAATYTVPIAIPPGIGGMAPNLSLAYNSQGPNGIAGQGWALAGASMIHRCPRNRLQDERGTEPVRISDDDGICLDGQRLIENPTGGGYFLESEQFVSIEQQALAAPAKLSETGAFKVTTKSGEVRLYGGRASTVVKKPFGTGGYPLIWLLSHVSDQWGNYFELHYNKDRGDEPTSAGFLGDGINLTSIDYTGFRGTASAPDQEDPTQDPFWRVSFDYESRTDVRLTRFADVTIPRKSRLKTVTVSSLKAPLTTIGTYSLAYLPADPTHMLPSRLWHIGYCSPSGGSTSCLDPLVFDWEGGDFGFAPGGNCTVVGNNAPSCSGWAIPDRLDPRDINAPARTRGNQFVDLNGDGRPEFVIARPNKTTVYRNGPTGFVLEPNWKLPENIVDAEGDPRGVLFADMDNNGLVDIVSSAADSQVQPRIYNNRLRAVPGCSANQCWELQAAQTTTSALRDKWGDIDFHNPGAYALAEMNGDGRPDIVRFREVGFVDVFWNTGSAWADASAAATPTKPQISYTFPESNCRLRDVNRDGMADAVCERQIGINLGTRGVGGTAWKTGDLSPEPRPFGDVAPGARAIGDVDGDGVYDLVDVYPYKINLDTCVATESNAVGPQPRQVALGTGSGYASDGVGSVYLQSLNDYLLPQNYTFPVVTGCPQYWLLRNHMTAMGDFNADGLVDIVVYHDDGFGNGSPQFQGGQLLVNTGEKWADHDGGLTRSETAPATPIPGVPAHSDSSGIVHGALNATAAIYLDLDGDGVTDVLKTWTEGNVVKSEAFLNTFKPAKIRVFPNGVASRTAVTYETTTRATATSPYQEIETNTAATTYLALPISVVTSVLAEDGQGKGVRSLSSYTYRKLRGSSTGRGPQGFGEIAVEDQASGVTTTTRYVQAYPYTGRPWEVVKTKKIELPPAGSTPSFQAELSRTTTTYCDGVTENGGQLQCTGHGGPAPGAPYVRPTASLFVYASRVRDETRVYAAPNSPSSLITTITDYRYDNRGNPLRVTTAMGNSTESRVSETINTYGAPGSVYQRRGKVVTSAVTTRQVLPLDSSVPSQTRSTRYEYDTSEQSLRVPLPLVKTLVEPGAGFPVEVHTAYAYDDYGNITTTTECQDQFGDCTPGASRPPSEMNPPFRTSTVSYDPADFNAPSGGDLISALAFQEKGRFPVKLTNALRQVKYLAHDPAHGVVVQETAIDGLHTCYQHDVFGRKNREVQRCGSDAQLVTTIRHHRAPSGNTEAATMTVVRQAPGGAVTWSYSDRLGRVVRTRTLGFSGDMFDMGSTAYNAQGQVQFETKPQIEGQAGAEGLVLYDPLGRVQFRTQNLGVIDGRGGSATDVTTVSYDHLSVTTERTVAGVTQKRTETKNTNGQVVSVKTFKDTTSVEMKYRYRADGILEDAIDPLGNVVHSEYDVRGRKIFSSDPDMGNWQYVYNGFGDLISQTDPKGQSTTMGYDALGRMTSKTDGGGTATWVFDVGPGAGVGKLAAMASAPDDLLGECEIPFAGPRAKRAGRSFKYTTLGQLEESTECVDGVTATTSYTYDTASRPEIVTYPAVRGARLALRHHYTSSGYLHYITDMADGLIYWVATARNALGQVTKEYTRNGVETVADRNAIGWLRATTSTSHADADKVVQQWGFSFDEVGNLRTRSRTDQVVAANSTETLDYDTLNRLKSSRVQVPSLSNYDVTDSFDYDDIGNLQLKSGAVYTYSGCLAGSRPAGPHAVCTAAGSSFEYDLNGNMISGAGRTVTYNAQNKPRTFTQAGDSVDFVYGADGDRVVQVVAGSAPGRTLYFGLGATGKSLYERTTRGNSVEHVQFIYAGDSHGGSAFAVKVTTDVASSQPAPPAMRYNLFDHLGSITATSDGQGRVVGATAGNWTASDVVGFDAWGARRNPDGRAADPKAFQPKVGRRDFTGHESIPNLGLVNMNGRVYDPVLGRFLSPDPNVQFVADLQSYNRYSYALNNPLRYTDPTGFFVPGTAVSVKTALGFGVGALSVAACAGTAGAGCAAAVLVGIVYTTAAMVHSGASNEAVVVSVVTGTLTGMAAGQFGGALAKGLGGDVAAQMIGGAVSGAVATALTSVFLQQDLGWNVLWGAAIGAATAGLSATGSEAPLSEASAEAAESLNQGGSDVEPMLGDIEGEMLAMRGARRRAGGRPALRRAAPWREPAPPPGSRFIPRGFGGNAEKFDGFVRNLKQFLNDAGFGGTTPVLQGSAVTGVSREGVPFDRGYRSDFDIALAGEALFLRAVEANIPIRQGPLRTAPLNISELQALGFSASAARAISVQAGREVNVMIFRTVEQAMSRGPSFILGR